VLCRERAPQCEQHAARGLGVAVAELLEREKLQRGEIALVLPPLGSSEFVALLAEVLELPRSRFLEVEDGGGDYFTSSLGYGLKSALSSKRARPGEIGLILTAGSGGQIGACTYRF
jgi:3-oxoacyl-[acyl-carrier-protein] synthase III